MEIEYLENTFLSEIVIKKFMHEEINDSLLIEFVPKVLKTSKIGNEVLKNWIDHFEGNFNGKKLKFKTPYVLTKDKEDESKTLWIERRF